MAYRVLLQKDKKALGVLRQTFKSSSAVDDYIDQYYPAYFYASDLEDSQRVKDWIKRFGEYGKAPASKSNPKTQQFDVTIRVPARNAKEARAIVERSAGERSNPVISRTIDGVTYTLEPEFNNFHQPRGFKVRFTGALGYYDFENNYIGNGVVFDTESAAWRGVKMFHKGLRGLKQS